MSSQAWIDHFNVDVVFRDANVVRVFLRGRESPLSFTYPTTTEATKEFNDIEFVQHLVITFKVLAFVLVFSCLVTVANHCVKVSST